MFKFHRLTCIETRHGSASSPRGDINFAKAEEILALLPDMIKKPEKKVDGQSPVYSKPTLGRKAFLNVLSACTERWFIKDSPQSTGTHFLLLSLFELMIACVVRSL